MKCTTTSCKNKTLFWQTFFKYICKKTSAFANSVVNRTFRVGDLSSEDLNEEENEENRGNMRKYGKTRKDWKHPHAKTKPKSKQTKQNKQNNNNKKKKKKNPSAIAISVAIRTYRVGELSSEDQNEEENRGNIRENTGKWGKIGNILILPTRGESLAIRPWLQSRKDAQNANQ